MGVAPVAVVVALSSCWAAGPGHAQNQFGRHLPPPHRNHGSAGAETGGQLPFHPLKGVLGETVRPADQNQIGRFQLFAEEFINITGVVQAGIGEALGLQGGRVGHHRASGQGLAVDDGHHPVEPDPGTDLGPIQGRDQGFWQG